MDAVAAKPRAYLVIHCHPGWKGSLGNALKNAAITHAKEIQSHAFPGLPTPPFANVDTTTILYCNNVDDGPKGGKPDDGPGTNPSLDNYTDSFKSIIAGCADDSIYYLAIFAHTGYLGNDSAIFFHPTTKVWANLASADVGHFVRKKFMKGAQIRLFGCYAGYGDNPIAKQVSAHLSDSTVYAYNYAGGSIGTNDRDIGHGKKDVPANPPNPKDGDTWYVTLSPGKKSVFQTF
jgi:hypothetical protein